MLLEKRSVEPIKGVDWQITNCCNYQCKYCIERQYDQKNNQNRFSDQKTISKVLQTILELPGIWQIKLVNGEPTMHPQFLDICGAISNSRHTIRLITNFSLSRKKLKQLIDICGAKLDSVSASLHIDQTDVEEFIEKTIWFDSIKNIHTQFTVNNVMTIEGFDKRKQIQSKLQKQGIKLHFQILKYKDKFVTYPHDIEEYLKDKLSTNHALLRSKSFFGKECYTGKLFFIIDLDGNAYRCYSMMKDGYLGNIVNGTFERNSEPIPCLVLKCTCAVAANQNMILYKKRRNVARVIKHLTKSKEFDKKLMRRTLKKLFIGKRMKR